MQSSEKKNIVYIRLFPEEDINKGIKEACEKHNITTGVILSGIGQAKNVKLGYFKEKGDYSPKEFEKPLEILSLTGNICKQNDDSILHLHIMLGDENKNSIGGHFIEGTISVTGEIVLLKTSVELNRKLNEKTGLMDLFLE